MKSVKYPDASLKKFFSLNPAVLFSPFQPAIWWAFYILLPFIALAESNPAHFMPFANYGDDAVDTWQSMQLCCLYMCYNTF